MEKILGGIILLIVLGCIQPRKEKEKLSFGSAVSTFLLFFVLGVFGIKSACSFLNLIEENKNSAIVKGCLQDIEAANPFPDNVIVLDGGSHVEVGINGEQLCQMLEQEGFSNVVWQLSLSGGNHFERYYMHHKLLSFLTAEEKRQLKKANVLLLTEISGYYDFLPLRSFFNNHDSKRVLSYLTLNNYPTALSALMETQGKDYTPQNVKILTKVFLMNLFNIGLADRVEWIGSIKPKSGFLAIEKSKVEVDEEKIGKVLADIQKFDPDVYVDWIDTSRDQRLEELYNGYLDQRIEIYPPTLISKYHAYARNRQDKHPERLFLLPDRELMFSLAETNYWKNNGHLTKYGAKRYTPWVAKRLIAAGVLQQ